MINTELKEAIRNAYTAYASGSENFTHREAQQKMISLVAKNFSLVHEGDERPSNYVPPTIIIQGPTGTGKTAAYLLASLPSAKFKQKKVVISTATVALQEQLFKRDIPNIHAKSGIQFSYALAKGRQRYICPTLLLEKVSGEDDLFEEMGSDNQVQSLKIYETFAEALLNKQWSGDRDLWPQQIENSVWNGLTTDSSGCSGRQCSAYNECPFYAARKEVQDADVIVANHDLVLTSLRYDGGTLPPPSACYYIIDEAHHLSSKSLSHLSHSHRIRATRKWLTKAPGIVKGALTALANFKNYREDPKILSMQIDPHVDNINNSLKELSAVLNRSDVFDLSKQKKPQKQIVWRFTNGVVPQGILVVANPICSEADLILKRLEQIKDDLSKKVRSGDLQKNHAEKIIPKIGQLQRLFDNLSQTWKLYSEDQYDEPPVARWISQDIDEDGDFEISASPISAASHLNKLLWSQCAGAVMTSATLTALGTFNRYSEEVGLKTNPESRFFALESPFDFDKNAVLHIPNIKSIPSNKAAFTAEITEWMASYLNPSEGTLVLFSSYWQMRQVLNELPDSISSDIMLQGSMSNSEIIKQHKARIDNGLGSIIFGTDSMAEGVDLPGKYLTHVVITKLPFSVPDNPVSEALAEYVEAQGRNPFLDLSVPEASIKLVQACGRLIRTEKDTGKVTILDRRLVSKRYGREMLEDLPPMRRCID